MIRSVRFIALIMLCFLCFTSKAQIVVTADSTTVGTYNVLELTINHPRSYANNWEDVTVSVVFSGPQTINVNGFFYDTNIWKVRFAPPEAGKWTFAITFTTPDNTYTDTGSFNCIPSATRGYLKRHPNNPFRLIHPDGTLFNSIGFEDCIMDFANAGTPLDFGLDGGFITPGYGGTFVKLDPYMNAYGANGAGFNLFRWTTDNCSFKLYNSITTTGNTYLIKEGMYGDTLVRSLRANKIRIWLTFFGPPVYNNIDGSNANQDAAIERYINYVVARYGAYVDIWELFNESSATDYYYNTITAYIRSIDPFKRLISVSDERPALAAIDINAPHWYEKESELESDARAATMINSRKSYNKPIIFGEQGNSVQNWDTLSSVRMRLRAWTSFFVEGTLIFWNTSNSKSYFNSYAANIYLGPTEREYIKTFQNFTAAADSTTVIEPISVSNSNVVRAYGLSSSGFTFGYFHHFATHASNVTTSFKTRLKRSGMIYWINPSNNSIVSSSAVSFGTQTVNSPPFNIDLAMKIVFNENFTATDLSRKLEVIVYPNPASTEIAIDGNFNGTASLDLLTTSGQKVLSLFNLANDQKVSLPNLNTGVYIYRITASGRQSAGKVIIVKNR